jgi:hypothetical protein
MRRLELWISRGFRERVYAVYPGLANDSRFRRLFAYLLTSTRIDPRTGRIVLARTILARLAGKQKQLAWHRYSGQAFLKEYVDCTGHELKIASYNYKYGLTRQLRDLNLHADIELAWCEELACTDSELVDFVSGRKLTRQIVADLRRTNRTSAAVQPSVYPETQAALAYLNDHVSPQRSGKALQQHGALAMVAAYARTQAASSAGESSRFISARRDLAILLAMRAQPQQFYKASRRNRSRRVFPAHLGYGMLSSASFALLAQAWHEFDLQSAQLAICGVLWNVPEVNAFIKSDRTIWEELCAYLGLGLDVKPALKDALYALIFGARLRTIRRELRRSGCFTCEEASHVAQRLLAHPLISTMMAARDEQLAKIRTDGGAFDCYGTWIAMPYDGNAKGRRRGNPRSVLATLAQALEFRITAWVFDLARNTTDFYITHFAHDGFCLEFVKQRRAEAVVQRVIAEVEKEAKYWGVETSLQPARKPN